MNDGNQSERLNEKESSGNPWEISDPEDSEERQAEQLGSIEKWEPIPTLKKLFDRLFPHGR
jgi:hypothetical protein